LIAKKAVEAANIGLQSAKSERGSALAEYEDAREATGDLSVTAPCSGIVWSLTVSKGDAVQTKGASSASSSGPAASGDSATSGSSSAPVTIAPEEPLAVHLAVNEVDVPSLRVGQRAEIELDALPDFVGTGKVYEIARSATSSSGVVTFDVWVSLDVASEEMRPGMSAAATIVTDIARDVLVVPNSAVHPDGTGGYYVLVLDAGASEPRKVTVKTGLASATETQIVSGLGAGDVVVTQTVDSSADSGQQQFGPGGGGMMMGIDRGVPHD
jgi:HlyD family secretion protein